MKMMTYEEFGRFGAGCTKEYLVGQGGIPGTIMTVLKMMVVEGMVVERHGGRDDGDDNDDCAGGEEGCLVRPGGMRGPNRKDAGRKRQGSAIPTNTRTRATSICGYTKSVDASVKKSIPTLSSPLSDKHE